MCLGCYGTPLRTANIFNVGLLNLVHHHDCPPTLPNLPFSESIHHGWRYRIKLTSQTWKTMQVGYLVNPSGISFLYVKSWVPYGTLESSRGVWDRFISMRTTRRCVTTSDVTTALECSLKDLQLLFPTNSTQPHGPSTLGSWTHFRSAIRRSSTRLAFLTTSRSRRMSTPSMISTWMTPEIGCRAPSPRFHRTHLPMVQLGTPARQVPLEPPAARARWEIADQLDPLEHRGTARTFRQRLDRTSPPSWTSSNSSGWVFWPSQSSSSLSSSSTCSVSKDVKRTKNAVTARKLNIPTIAPYPENEASHRPSQTIQWVNRCWNIILH